MPGVSFYRAPAVALIAIVPISTALYYILSLLYTVHYYPWRAAYQLWTWCVTVCDRARRIERCASLALLIVDVARNGGWLRLWDSALDLGHRHTRGLQNLTRLMSHHGQGTKLCPLCEEHNVAYSVISHVFSMHKDIMSILLLYRCSYMYIYSIPVISYISQLSLTQPYHISHQWSTSQIRKTYYLVQ